jgi:hypothetical protein
MGRLIDHGWQKSAANAAQPTGIITGANLKKPKKLDKKKIEKPKTT